MTMSSLQVLDREFLEMRAKILELAATLDRMDRGDGSVHDDTRMHHISQAIDLLRSDSSDRAERVQLLFSREYKPEWREEFQIN